MTWYWAAQHSDWWASHNRDSGVVYDYVPSTFVQFNGGLQPNDTIWLMKRYEGRWNPGRMKGTNIMIKRMTKEEAEIGFILLNVGKNMWMKKGEGFELEVETSYLPGPSDQKPKVDVEGGVIVFGGYTTELSEAVMVKRPWALQQFLVDCRKDSTNYNIPVRVVDLVACQLGIEG